MPSDFFLYAGMNTIQATSTCISLACLQICAREAAPRSTCNKCWDGTLHLLTLQRELAMLPQVHIGSFQLCVYCMMNCLLQPTSLTHHTILHVLQTLAFAALPKAPVHARASNCSSTTKLKPCRCATLGRQFVFLSFLAILCILSHYLPFQDHCKVFIARTSERFLPKLLDNSIMPLLVRMDVFAAGPKRHP